MKTLVIIGAICLSAFTIFGSKTNPEQFQNLTQLFPEVKSIHYTSESLSKLDYKLISSPLLDFFPDARNSQFSRLGPDSYYAVEQITSETNTKLLVVARLRSYEKTNRYRYFLYVFNAKGNHSETINLGYLQNIDCKGDGKKITVKANQNTTSYVFAAHGKVTKMEDSN